MHEKLKGIVNMAVNAFIVCSINCKNEFLTNKIFEKRTNRNLL